MPARWIVYYKQSQR